LSAVVSDSSPLNYLALLSDFDLLRKLYSSLIIPPTVHREVVESGVDYPVSNAVSASLGAWISVAETPLASEVAALQEKHRLDRGESEAILVAESLGKVPLLMDEQRGVRCARSRGLTVIRTPLIYADAKMLGLVESVRKKLDDLRVGGFHLSDRHYEMILREVGEL
jgi:predicted nucleic acid-binding protein